MKMTNPNVNVAGSGISLGVTLYSFTNEWWSGQYDLEGLIAAAVQNGLGPGIEMVGFQSIRTFPDVTDAFVDEWHRIVDEHDIVATCLGSNIDVGLFPNRGLTDDEMVEYLNRQLEVAGRLGFPIVRIQIGAKPSVIERCLPTAEKYGITMGMEVHAPEGPRTEAILRVIDFYDRVDSPLLGFIPDFSSTMRRNPPGFLESLVRDGLPREQLSSLVDAWAGEGASNERFGRFAAQAEADGIDRSIISGAFGAFTMNGREPLESWADFEGRIVHVHGKCYEFDAEGNEPSIDYPAIAQVIVGTGFKGWISTEWEGHTFSGVGEVDTFSVVGAQQALLRRSIAEAVRG